MRRLVVVGVVLGLAVGLAGCGSSSVAKNAGTSGPSSSAIAEPTGTRGPVAISTTTTTAVTPTTSTTWAAAPSTVGLSGCLSSQLGLKIEMEGVAAGSVGAVVNLSNRSKRVCTLYGYPNLQMLSGSVKEIPTEVVHGTSTTVSAVPESIITLAPGVVSSFEVGYSDGTGYRSAACPTSARVGISPPGDADMVVKWAIQPYGGASIAQLECGEIHVSPIYAGSGMWVAVG